jgi:hypothetical protein
MAIIKPGQLSSGSYSISGSFSGSFFGNGSNLTNLPTSQIETGSFVTTSSFNAFTGSYNTGSFTGSFIGNGSGLTGVISSSYALTASYAVSASYEINYETSSSYAETASVAYFAQTASYVSSIIKGEATINFGPTPGSNYAITTVSSSLVTNNSNINIYIMSTSSADHNTMEHQIFSLYGTVIPDNIINNTSFDIIALSELRLDGTFKVKYTINNN